MSGQTNQEIIADLVLKATKLRDEIHKERMRLIEIGQTASSEKLQPVDNQMFDVVCAVSEASEEII